MNITCSSCKTSNSLYLLNCLKCGAVLRNKVSSIDLWKTISGLLESPQKTFINIIQSDQKNYIFLLIGISGLVYSFYSYWLSMILFQNNKLEFLQVGKVIILITVLYFIVSLVISSVNKLKHEKTRVRDTFAVIVYSQIPVIVFGTFLLILKLAVFGSYIFSLNPDPFEIKPLFAYLFSGLTILIIIWSLTLAIISIYIQLGNWLISVLLSLLLTIFTLTSGFLII